MICPECTAAVPDDDHFCEICGARLQGAELADVVDQVSVCACGATAEAIDEEGFCNQCGMRALRPASDHREEALSPECAAVSDRGQRHDRNEDRFLLLQHENSHVLVVCDGVSTTHASETAAALVAEEVGQRLRDRLTSGEGFGPDEAMREALAAASQALCSRTGGPRGIGPEQDAQGPSTTVVAALVLEHRITLGWAGDSRAYWIDDRGAQRLTRDHSWAEKAVAEGLVSRDAAEASPQAHAITRWLGRDANEASPAEVLTWKAPGSGVLLLCTDGLWNCFSKTGDGTLADVCREAGGLEPILQVAQRLVQFANDKGGADNITAALLRVGDLGFADDPATVSEQSTQMLRRAQTGGEHAESIQGRDVSE